MRALIAMSGGVDSSVAAELMKEQGYECVGCTMRLYENDTEDARSVTESIGISHHVFHFEKQFEEEVIEPFINEYEAGRTPNPCVTCNRCLKFGHLLEKMKEYDCDVIVTGHYAQIGYDNISGRYLLKKAADESKDQSYVLYTLSQYQLEHIRFPLGSLSKAEARDIAAGQGFINAHKSDSQDICFIPDGDYVAFMERYRNRKYVPGDFVDMDGNVLGRHKGFVHYTIGQRKGLGIAAGHPLYVVDIRPETNTVVLGSNEDLFSKELIADRINLISVNKIDGQMRVKAKIRYRHREQDATVTQLGEDRIKVVFDEPQRAITKGQAVVLYDGDVVVGGGTII